MAVICLANAAPLSLLGTSGKPTASGMEVPIFLLGYSLREDCNNTWIASEAPKGCFKSSFRCSQWKGACGKPRRTRICWCNQSECGLSHCRESIQPQELWNVSGVPGMSSVLPVSFLVYVFLFSVCFLLLYFFLPQINTDRRNCSCFLQPQRMHHFPPVILIAHLL